MKTILKTSAVIIFSIIFNCAESNSQQILWETETDGGRVDLNGRNQIYELKDSSIIWTIGIGPDLKGAWLGIFKTDKDGNVIGISFDSSATNLFPAYLSEGEDGITRQYSVEVKKTENLQYIFRPYIFNINLTGEMTDKIISETYTDSLFSNITQQRTLEANLIDDIGNIYHFSSRSIGMRKYGLFAYIWDNQGKFIERRFIDTLRINEATNYAISIYDGISLNDGSFVLHIANTQGRSYLNSALLKLNKNLEIEWLNVIEDTDSTTYIVYKIFPSADKEDAYVFGGVYNYVGGSEGSSNHFFRKYDKSGNLVKECPLYLNQSFNYYDVIAAKDGGVFIVGDTVMEENDNFYISGYISKYDKFGYKEWLKVFDKSDNFSIKKACLSGDDSILLSGMQWDNEFNYQNLFLIKIKDETSNVQYVSVQEIPAHIYPNPAVVGKNISLSITGLPPGEIFVETYNSAGESVLQRQSFVISGKSAVLHLNKEAELRPGAYFVKIFHCTVKTFTSKFVVH